MFDSIPADRQSVRHERKPGLTRLLDWLLVCCARARQRRALARLDARLLADIGVGASEAAEECAKPFWR